MTKKFSAVIVAGGTGSRMGRPKQLLKINGIPCLFRSIKTFEAAGASEIIVVSGAEVLKEVKKEFPSVITAPPAATRLGSVVSGVKKAKFGVIAVHDGARPLVKKEHILKTAASAAKYGAALLAVKSKDTIKSVSRGIVAQTPDRNTLYQAQTPQAYKAGIIKEALKKYGHLKNATDESQLVEKLGVKVHIVDGDYTNIKITEPSDIQSAESFLGSSLYRTGFGFDLHRLVEGRPFIIGGVKIPHKKGFLGHSDGDLVLHAICDAALGAAVLGEIGMLFPPTDEKIKGISSVKIAKTVLELLKKHGFEIVHIDATLVTEEPKIKPHYEAVRKSLNKIFGAGLENISFKCKSYEGVGEIGAGNAAVCHALVAVKKQN